MTPPDDDDSTLHLERVILWQRISIWLSLGAAVAFLGLWLQKPEPPRTGRVGYDQLAEIRKALDLYHLDRGLYPPTLSALTVPSEDWPDGFLPEIPLDPWRRRFVYRRASYVLFSKGPDGRAGTADDLLPDR